MKMQTLQKFARNQNQVYRSITKTLLRKEQIWDWSKQCAPMNVYFH